MTRWTSGVPGSAPLACRRVTSLQDSIGTSFDAFGLEAFPESVSGPIEDDTEIVGGDLQDLTNVAGIDVLDFPEHEGLSLAVRQGVEAVAELATGLAPGQLFHRTPGWAGPAAVATEARFHHFVNVFTLRVPGQGFARFRDLVKENPVQPGRGAGPPVEFMRPSAKHQERGLHGVFGGIAIEPCGLRGPEQARQALMDNRVQGIRVSLLDSLRTTSRFRHTALDQEACQES